MRPLFSTIALSLALLGAAPTVARAQTRSGLGASYDAAQGTITFRVFSSRATRIELCLFSSALGESEKARIVLAKDPATNVWSTTVSLTQLASKGITGTLHYGYRAFGPNWPFTGTWTPGSTDGFVADWDGQGNRFNPNKLLLDPYAFEMTHDPVNPQQRDGTVFASGPKCRALDSAKQAPKGLVVADKTSTGSKPTRALKDEVIYEAHVRGLTAQDPTVPAQARGTYKGAAMKAAYLKQLGVTAIELLPVQETQNDQNDLAIGTDGDNYWGYMTLAYFAPDRRYASDKSAGGPTREFKDMVRAFHAQGIKVYMDVVYNHTGEGGLWDGTGETVNVQSFRGLDNAAYYELANDPRFYYDNTGCGGNVNCANLAVRQLIVDSLAYWKDSMGVDGFRFDLGVMLGNSVERSGFQFDRMDPANALNRAVRELPVRPASGGAGIDLIAEPWGIGNGTQQLGNFPHGWAEWNAVFRDTLRRAQNKLGVDRVNPGQLASVFAGSSGLFQDDGRKPWHSINFMVAHDGFTLADLYRYNGKNNNQPWPFGASDGGTDDNLSWDQGNDATLQRQAARNGMAFLMLSAGTPMITGGDELLRTQFGNNNAYNLDSEKNWLDWTQVTTNRPFFNFSSKLIAFRRAHPALRPAEFFRGSDANGNGLKDITWLTDKGVEASGSYMDDANNHFLAYRVDGTEKGDAAASIYVATNGWSGTVTATLPANLPGKRWYRVLDTAAWMESRDNIVVAGSEELMTGTTYGVNGRSVVVMIER